MFTTRPVLLLPELWGRNWRNVLDVPTVGGQEMVVPNAPKNLCWHLADKPPNVSSPCEKCALLQYVCCSSWQRALEQDDILHLFFFFPLL